MSQDHGLVQRYMREHGFHLSQLHEAQISRQEDVSQLIDNSLQKGALRWHFIQLSGGGHWAHPIAIVVRPLEHTLFDPDHGEYIYKEKHESVEHLYKVIKPAKVNNVRMRLEIYLSAA